jgi:hypothetical protein
MQFRVHALQVRQSYLLGQDHFVEAWHEVCIQESSMENTESETPTDELEIAQVVRIDSGCRINL